MRTSLLYFANILGLGGWRHYHRLCSDGLPDPGANRPGACLRRHGLRPVLIARLDAQRPETLDVRAAYALGVLARRR